MTRAKRNLAFIIFWLLYGTLFGLFLSARSSNIFSTMVVGIITLDIMGLTLYYGSYHLKIRYFFVIAVIISILSAGVYMLIDRDILDESRRLAFFFQCIFQTISFSTTIALLQYLIQCFIEKKQEKM